MKDYVGAKFYCPHALPLMTATSASGLERRCWSSAQQCYLHCLHIITTNQYNLVTRAQQLLRWTTVPEQSGSKSRRGQLSPFPWRELGPHLTQCRLGRGLPPYQMASWSIQPFGHNTPTLQTHRTMVLQHSANHYFQRLPKKQRRFVSEAGS